MEYSGFENSCFHGTYLLMIHLGSHDAVVWFLLPESSGRLLLRLSQPTAAASVGPSTWPYLIIALLRSFLSSFFLLLSPSKPCFLRISSSAWQLCHPDSDRPFLQNWPVPWTARVHCLFPLLILFTSGLSALWNVSLLDFPQNRSLKTPSPVAHQWRTWNIVSFLWYWSVFISYHRWTDSVGLPETVFLMLHRIGPHYRWTGWSMVFPDLMSACQPGLRN